MWLDYHSLYNKYRAGRRPGQWLSPASGSPASWGPWLPSSRPAWPPSLCGAPLASCAPDPPWSALGTGRGTGLRADQRGLPRGGVPESTGHTYPTLCCHGTYGCQCPGPPSCRRPKSLSATTKRRMCQWGRLRRAKGLPPTGRDTASNHPLTWLPVSLRADSMEKGSSPLSLGSEPPQLYSLASRVPSGADSRGLGCSCQPCPQEPSVSQLFQSDSGVLGSGLLVCRTGRHCHVETRMEGSQEGHPCPVTSAQLTCPAPPPCARLLQLSC